VEVGLVAACITFIYRISSLSRSEELGEEDYPELRNLQGQVSAYRLYGALFFGAVKLIEDLQDKMPARTLLLDLKNVIYIDSSGADSLNDLARACHKNRVRLVICGLMHQPLDIARRCGFAGAVGEANIHPNVASAIRASAGLSHLDAQLPATDSTTSTTAV
jgi:SulP family sulfate permease